MSFAENYYPKTTTKIDGKLLLPAVISLINTYCVDSFIDLEKCLLSFSSSNKCDQATSNTLFNFNMSADQNNLLLLELRTTKLELKYKIDLNAEFPCGVHTLIINEKDSKSFQNAMIQLVQKIISGEFISSELPLHTKLQQQALKNPIDPSKPKKALSLEYLNSDVNYHNNNTKGVHFQLTISNNQVTYGQQDYSQMTMSAASGGRANINFEQLLNGEIDDWVINNFSQAILTEIKTKARAKLN